MIEGQGAPGAEDGGGALAPGDTGGLPVSSDGQVGSEICGNGLDDDCSGATPDTC